MAKYIFFTFPEYGHVNPTLAIAAELLARGEQVIYYLAEPFREVIEATGATFRALPFNLIEGGQKPDFSSADANKHLAMLPLFMVQKSSEMVPPLLERIRAEQADSIVCDIMFLWGRMVAHLLHIPAVALCPTYAMNAHFNVYDSAQNSTSGPGLATAFTNELTQISVICGLPLSETHTPFMGAEPLTIVFLPRAFQPEGSTFDERFLFVGPSFQAHRDARLAFPLEQLGTQPTLYISLGTTFNKQVEFYQQCMAAFGGTSWQVVLSHGARVDQAELGAIPRNILAAPHVPQLEVLPRTDIFLSHGGMNSVMESLSCGVPLIVIPQIREQEVTAQRVRELGLGIVLDRAAITIDGLREAVVRVAHDSTFRIRAQAMQRMIQEAGGYKRAADAIVQYIQVDA
ncbi:MAG TPA: macrolide family glycosyltransferase [Ktedonobacteraceae bacterium]